MNKVFLVGRLTKAPVLMTTNSGISVCKFTLAVDRRFGEKQTDFIPIVTWKGLAENCSKYLNKGSEAAICGSVQIRTYEDKNGQKRYVTEVVADEVQFIGGKKDYSEDFTEIDNFDDIPF